MSLNNYFITSSIKYHSSLIIFKSSYLSLINLTLGNFVVVVGKNHEIALLSMKHTKFRTLISGLNTQRIKNLVVCEEKNHCKHNSHAILFFNLESENLRNGKKHEGFKVLPTNNPCYRILDKYF